MILMVEESERSELNIKREEAFKKYFSNYLTISLIISSLSMSFGFFLYILDPYPITTDDLTIILILNEIINLSSEGILFFGIIILLLSPVGGVLLSIVYYIKIKDKDFILISIIVFCSMIFGITFNVK
jgi:uncharacterized membrane protein